MLNRSVLRIAAVFAFIMFGQFGLGGERSVAILLAAEPVGQTPAEARLAQLLGEGTPEPIGLWPDRPPRFNDQAPPETVEDRAAIRGVSVPTISVYLPPREKATGMAIIVCPGGGYGALDWRTHVVYAAQVFNPQGVAIVGLKYRTRPPNGTTNEEIREIALLDAQRAVRLVRNNAEKWQLDPRQIGIAGYSAGGNLAMNLAANFDSGNPKAADAVDRESCRPDFAIGLATWHLYFEAQSILFDFVRELGKVRPLVAVALAGL